MKTFLKTILVVLLLIIEKNSIEGNSQVQTFSVPDWNTQYAQNGINNNCRMFKDKCLGMCTKTNKKCEKMMNFNETVCGCVNCFYNRTLKLCTGQCQNTFLQTCVSKVANPTSTNDCACASCKATWQIITTTGGYYYAENDGTGQVATCDDSTCYPGNSCSFFYASMGRRPISDTLYCKCNNDNTPRTAYLLAAINGKK
jgi:hypothetical protein